MMTLDDELLEPQSPWVVPEAGVEPARLFRHCPLNPAQTRSTPDNTELIGILQRIETQYTQKHASKTPQTRPMSSDSISTRALVAYYAIIFIVSFFVNI